jgi:TRAP-type C4-dicarboxylate transport system substrate-binding protein
LKEEKMKNRALKKSIIFVLALGGIPLIIGGFANAAQTSAKPMTLAADSGPFASFSSEGMGLKFFGDEVEKRTNGLIKFKYTWSNVLTKSGEE